jgi:hypothetical protein
MESLKVCAITIHLESVGQAGIACRSDLDLHAEVSVVGMETKVFQDFERPVNVSGYDTKGPVAGFENSICWNGIRRVRNW